MRNAYIILVRKPEGKIPFWITTCRWEDNITIETGCDNVNWIHLAQDKVK
jgi:hypothetical protein